MTRGDLQTKGTLPYRNAAAAMFDTKGKQAVTLDDLLANTAKQLARHRLIGLILKGYNGPIAFGGPNEALKA